MTSVVLKDVTLAGDQRPRLDRVSLRIGSDSTPAAPIRTAIVGYSGAGKTSLLHVIAGFEEPTSGTIAVDSSDASMQSRLPLYWVPQNGGLWNHLTVEQHLLKAQGREKSNTDLLERLDLAQRRKAYPPELSQGERSRVALARALSANADLLVMDEPLSHVDPVRKPHFWSVIEDVLQTTRTSLIFSSHEPEIVLRWSSEVVCVHEGKILFHGSTRSVYSQPPNEQVGQFLGPLNWFSQKECLLLLDLPAASHHGLPVRPEHLEIAASSSPVELLSTAFCGSYWQSEIRHRETSLRKVICHRSKLAIPAGSLVKLHWIRHDASEDA